MNGERTLAIVVIGIILLAVIAEAVMIVMAFLGADEVECNLVWCTFTTVKKESSIECYMNGKMINCSEMIA